MSKTIKIGVLAVLIVLFILLSIVIVPTGYTGVKTTFGQISKDPVVSGFCFRAPLVQNIRKVNNKQQDMKIKSQIWSETAERTALYYENITVSYTIVPEYSAWIVANVNDYNDSLITHDLVASAIKTASKQLASADATNRGFIEPLTQECLQNAINVKYGNSVVIINKITISDADFDESYSKAIATKQTEQIAYETQKIQNQKIIEQANKDAEVVRIQTEYQTEAKVKQAEADAKVKLITAEAQADANSKIAKSLTADLIQKMYYDKWDGKLPTMITGASTDLIINP